MTEPTIINGINVDELIIDAVIDVGLLVVVEAEEVQVGLATGDRFHPHFLRGGGTHHTQGEVVAEEADTLGGVVCVAEVQVPDVLAPGELVDRADVGLCQHRCGGESNGRCQEGDRLGHGGLLRVAGRATGGPVGQLTWESPPDGTRGPENRPAGAV